MRKSCQRIVSPSSLRALLRRDSTFERILDDFGPPPDWRRAPGFSTLCQIIIEQQVSLDSAAACYRRLRQGLGDVTPKKIERCDEQQLKLFGLSKQKARYLKALAQAVTGRQIDLQRLDSLPSDVVYQQLTAITGIGPWTASIYLMFCLRAPDIFPLGDVAAINTVQALWGVRDQQDLVDLTYRWKPYRSLATFCCWHHYLQSRNRSPPYDA
jgi:DNA-3-methyladenine glycosylase II